MTTTNQEVWLSSVLGLAITIQEDREKANKTRAEWKQLNENEREYNRAMKFAWSRKDYLILLVDLCRQTLEEEVINHAPISVEDWARWERFVAQSRLGEFMKQQLIKMAA